MCWAIEVCYGAGLLRQLGHSKPAKVHAALAELARRPRRLRELKQAKLALDALAHRSFATAGARDTMRELKQLWPNASSLIDWLNKYQPEMKPELAARAERILEELECGRYVPDEIRCAIRAGSSLLEQHITGRPKSR
jgi:hypothetical protein